MRRTILLLLLGVTLVGCNSKDKDCGRSFSLDQEDILALQKFSTKLRITNEELSKWDQVVTDQLKKEPLRKAGGKTRFYAYLYSAQKAFADESFYATGSYSGTIGPITVYILNLFYPGFSEDVEKDLYSESLATALGKRFKERFREEEKGIYPVEVLQDERKWNGDAPIGVKRPSLQPWVMTSADEFRGSKPPPSDHPFWEAQLDAVKSAVNGATDEQKEKSKYWAEVDADKLWMNLSEKYMKEKTASLQMRLEVREKLSLALIDGLIAVFDNKYEDRVKRPTQMDSSLRATIDVPNHPSCPSAHSTICTAAEVVLSYYFPENEAEWKQLSEEAGQSRIWAGVHFPVDHVIGKKQGFDVARAVIFR